MHVLKCCRIVNISEEHAHIKTECTRKLRIDEIQEISVEIRSGILCLTLFLSTKIKVKIRKIAAFPVLYGCEILISLPEVLRKEVVGAWGKVQVRSFL
jgi:hypothetical protein